MTSQWTWHFVSVAVFERSTVFSSPLWHNLSVLSRCIWPQNRTAIHNLIIFIKFNTEHCSIYENNRILIQIIPGLLEPEPPGAGDVKNGQLRQPWIIHLDPQHYSPVRDQKWHEVGKKVHWSKNFIGATAGMENKNMNGICAAHW